MAKFFSGWWPVHLPHKFETSTTLEKSAPGRFHIPTIYLYLFIYFFGNIQKTSKGNLQISQTPKIPGHMNPWVKTAHEWPN